MQNFDDQSAGAGYVLRLEVSQDMRVRKGFIDATLTGPQVQHLGVGFRLRKDLAEASERRRQQLEHVAEKTKTETNAVVARRCCGDGQCLGYELGAKEHE
jgi:hypothetical protein